MNTEEVKYRLVVEQFQLGKKEFAQLVSDFLIRK
jgi:hypothetical protein